MCISFLCDFTKLWRHSVKTVLRFPGLSAVWETLPSKKAPWLSRGSLSSRPHRSKCPAHIEKEGAFCHSNTYASLPLENSSWSFGVTTRPLLSLGNTISYKGLTERGSCFWETVKPCAASILILSGFPACYFCSIPFAPCGLDPPCGLNQKEARTAG